MRLWWWACKFGWPRWFDLIKCRPKVEARVVINLPATTTLANLVILMMFLHSEASLINKIHIHIHSYTYTHHLFIYKHERGGLFWFRWVSVEWMLPAKLSVCQAVDCGVALNASRINGSRIICVCWGAVCLLNDGPGLLLLLLLLHLSIFAY
jgi:hypothetical protein